MCERASASNIFETGFTETSITMIKYDADRTYELPEFADLQNAQISSALEKLYSFKEKVMEIAYTACIVSCELLA
jgi:hypothetical protein